MNVVILMGRMTRDPELKYTSGGKAFANFSLAVQKTVLRGKKLQKQLLNTLEKVTEFLYKDV